MRWFLDGLGVVNVLAGRIITFDDSVVGDSWIAGMMISGELRVTSVNDTLFEN